MCACGVLVSVAWCVFRGVVCSVVWRDVVFELCCGVCVIVVCVVVFVCCGVCVLWCLCVVVFVVVFGLC